MEIRYRNKTRNIVIVTVIVTLNIILRKYQKEKIRITAQFQMSEAF